MKLILDNGKEFQGRIFGYPKEVKGEVVFNTAMTGYPETLTDPSYCGQILVITYPLVGNYGVPKGPFESGNIQPIGLVVTNYSEIPSHFTKAKSLADWLKSEKIPAITGVDTRSLTRHLRSRGAIRGRMIFDELDKHTELRSGKIESVDMDKVISIVSGKKVKKYGDGNKKVLLVDTGGKENIINSLVNRGVSVIRAPWHYNWEDFIPEADGLFFTNGPGDPIDAGDKLINRIKAILNVGKPIMGICFGHQLVALAAGASTYKMKYGHRSVNQPVRDLLTGKCYITSQNHGYVVQNESLPKGWRPWFVNLNDGTNEGIIHKGKNIRTVQFHPEAKPGPNDTAFLFDEYVKSLG